MLISPFVIAVLVAAIIVLWQTERNAQRLVFALAAFAALSALIALATGDMERAILLATVVSVAIIGFSGVKFHHSARALILADTPLLFAGTVPFFFTQYRRMMTSVIGGGALLVLLTIGILSWTGGMQRSVEVRFLCAAIAIALAFLLHRWNGGVTAFRQAVTRQTGSFSTFAASVLDVRSWWGSRALNAVAIANEALPLLPPVERAGAVQPDIILIQHESVFDPRLFGLPVTPDVASFLSLADGIGSALDVEIFGGGSWQSEFSVMTGIASGLFGTDAYFLFQRGVGRFRHSLPRELARQGYRTSLISSCRRGFLNYDNFYGAIGMDRLVFADDLPPPFDVNAFERTFTDADFLPAALEIATQQADPALPQFHYILTNYNHGPHSSKLASKEVAQQRAFALQSLGDEEYAEFYARLAVTAAVWAREKQRLVNRQRPTLIVHYGDHQPVMARRIEARLGLSADATRTFRTFFAIETVNWQIPCAVPTAVPIAYLGTIVLQAAGLPLDAITATRTSLLQRNDRERSRDETRLLRTLVDQKLVDLD